MISLNAKTLEGVLLSELHVAVMFIVLFPNLKTHAAKVCCRILQIAEPKALNLEKDDLVGT